MDLVPHGDRHQPAVVENDAVFAELSHQPAWNEGTLRGTIARSSERRSGLSEALRAFSASPWPASTRTVQGC